MVKIDRIINSRRKTYALVIELDGSLTVRAPMHASRQHIEILVQEKSGWIREKQNWIRDHPAAPHLKQYVDGELFYYLGNPYPLEIISSVNPGLRLIDGRFQLAQTAVSRAERLFTNWYRAQGRLVIGEMVNTKVKEYKLDYQSLRITSARGRWGSCGPKGSLNFSWRLVMAPPAVINYVVVHELVHLKIRNHSMAFWEQVAQWAPDYQFHIAWLKTNGRLLSL